MISEQKPISRDEALDQANELLGKKEYPAAAKIYQTLLAENPNWCPALWNYALLKQDLKDYRGAAELYKDCVAAPDIMPDIKANALNNLGIILLHWGKLDLAVQSYRFAIQIWPGAAEPRVNMAVVYRYLREHGKAKEWLKEALRLDPKRAEAHCEAACLHLTMGDLPRGFLEFEWRWRWGGFPTRPLKTKRPRWNGQKLNGHRVLITQEQGLGDSIHFIRYARMVQDRGGSVIAFVPSELHSVLATVEGVDKLIGYLVVDETDYDYHIPLMSLPRVFKTTVETIPNGVPYIHWDHYTPLAGDFRVGIIWAGRPEFGGDRWRSMPIETMAPLFDLPGITWYSLQYGPRAEEAKKFPQIINLSARIKDFADTASFLNSLELLIVVDTAAAHLAGAMGRPVWTMIPYSPDWRWLLDGETTRWYPTMRLFRESKRDDWPAVIQRIKNELCKRRICND